MELASGGCCVKDLDLPLTVSELKSEPAKGQSSFLLWHCYLPPERGLKNCLAENHSEPMA